MKKRTGLVSILFIFLLIFSSPVKAKEMEYKTISDLSKSWTVNFNKAIDSTSINSSTVYIKDSQGRNIDITLKTDYAGNKVTVTPKGKYTPGETYTLFMTKGIKDTAGLNLKEETYMNFNLKGTVKEDISKNPNYYVEQEITSDINGDGKEEKLQIVCNKTESYGGSTYHEEIRILIKNNFTNEVLEEIVPSHLGFVGSLETYDFNKDGSRDIMLNFPSMGSGGDVIYEIYSFKNNNLTQLLGESTSSGLMYPEEYIEFYFSKYDEEVEIWSDKYNKIAKFNFSNYEGKPSFYDYEGYFNLLYLEPFNEKSNGECDLKATSWLCSDYKQYIIEVQTIYFWDKTKGKWAIKDIEFLPIDDSINEVKEEFGLEEFRIENLDLGMSIEEIESLLGKPVSTKTNYDDAIGEMITYEYKKYTIDFSQDYYGEFSAFNIAFKSSETTGPRGIRVGDSVESVLDKFTREGNVPEYGVEFLYGEEFKNNGKIYYDENGDIYRLTFQYGEGSFGVLIFDLSITDNKVSKMEVWVAII